MGRNLITLNYYDSLAANASQDATKKAANVASATGAVIRELAAQVVMTGSSIAINASDTEPDDDAYWFFINNSIVNLKSPKNNGTRNPVYFASHISCIEGLSAPKAGDNEKFLRGDGTWVAPTFTLGSISSTVEGAFWLETNT